MAGRELQHPAGRPLARVIILAAAVLCFSLASTSVSIAAEDPEQLIREGVVLRRKGADLEALQRFQQAFHLGKTSRALAQIGFAEQALGRWVSAYEHLSEALASKSDAWVVKNEATIRQALEVVSDHVGKVEILGGSPGAELRINGVLAGTLPLPGPLTQPLGTITIHLSAPGLVPVERSSVVRTRQITRESFDALAPVPAGKPPLNRAPLAVRDEPGDSAAAGDTGLAAETTGQAPSGLSGAAERGEPGSVRASLKWVAWGMGAAATGLGIYGLVNQNSAADAFDKGCAIDAMGMIQPMAGFPGGVQACRDFKSRVDSNYRLELIGFAGAALFAATGVVLWLTEPAANAAISTASACAPTYRPGVPGVSCQLAF